MNKLISFLKMIKFSHTVFALPFAFSGAIMAYYKNEFQIEPLLWIIVAMIGARTAAMGFNRIVDAKIDKENPRTANREIPAGVISKTMASIYVLLFSALFIFAAYKLNHLCFYLSPVALIVVLGYSFMKRVSSLAHIVLGIGLSLAPIGAFLAIHGKFELAPVILGFAVMFWVAGFDIVYAGQDADYDKEVGLFSIPSRFGLRKALLIAKVFHFFAFLLLLAVGQIFGFGIIYFFGIFIIAAILIYEHRLVTVNDYSKIGMAFLNLNAVISMIYFLSVLLDFLLK
jgi:4-hydroxybenzoate polyprenyltransferase